MRAWIALNWAEEFEADPLLEESLRLYPGAGRGLGHRLGAGVAGQRGARAG
jgi:hypothetical protein